MSQKHASLWQDVYTQGSFFLNSVLTLSRDFFKISSPRDFIFVIVLIILWFLLSSHLWYGDIWFHTDLARDFLVLEEMLVTRSPTLIGPRSGGIPGVFHGPLWYYISLPFFWLVGGDPVGMGWFWWFLGIICSFSFLILVYSWTRDRIVSVLTTIGFSLLVLGQVASPVNNYGADLLSVFVFALWLKWYNKPKILYSIIGWLSLGILVQFQMAWAVPIAALWFPVFIYRSWRYDSKILVGHILSVCVFLLPLVTFFAFEVRHDWLQVRSVLNYIQQPSLSEMSMGERILDRGYSALTSGWNIFRIHVLANTLLLFSFGIAGWQTKKKEIQQALLVFGYLYFGWWSITLLFSGSIWGYYFSPFIGILFFLVALIAKEHKLLLGLLSAGIVLLLLNSQHQLMYTPQRFDGSSWVLLSNIAEDSLSETPIGYFVYSQDQFAYPLKYAFSFYVKEHPNEDIFQYEKRERTVLVKAPDDLRNPYLTAESWQRNSIRIDQSPSSFKTYPYGYRSEVYILDEQSRDIPIDENLLLDLHFR